MFTDAEILYLEEVLGTSAEAYRRRTQVEAGTGEATASRVAEVVILTSPLADPADRALLAKILSSVHLISPPHIETPHLGQWPESVETIHVLAFGGGEDASGRPEGTMWWRLPALPEMRLGAPEDVAAHKRRAWATLQRFQKARGK
jgi:hypothetical protein